MPPLLRQAWRLLRGAKVTTYALLMLGPMFVRPLDFVRQPNQIQPAYAKLPGLKSAPLLVSGVCAASAQSVYQWVFWLEMSNPAPAAPSADLLLRLHNTESLYFWGAFALTTMLVYVLAFLRWGYHCGFIHVLRKWRPELRRPPLLYFVVTTAAWGLWLSLYSAIIVRGLWQWKAQGDIGELVSAFVQSHQVSALVVLLIIGAAMKLAGRNSERGMKAIYGGSGWLYALVSMFAIGGLALLTLLLVKLLPAVG